MAKDILVRIRAENIASEVIARVRHDFTELVAGVATGTAIYNGFKGAVSATIDFLKDSVKAAGEAEKVTAELGRALVTVGATRTSDVKAIEEYAGALASTSTYSDEAIKSTMALLASIGRLSGDELKAATKATLDLSAATGKDLNSAAMAVAKAAAGSGTALGKLGVNMDDTLPAADRFKNALDQINAKFGGAAETQAGTLYGSLAQMDNALEKLKESLGALANASGASSWVSEAAHQYREWADQLERAANSGNTFADILERIKRGQAPTGGGARRLAGEAAETAASFASPYVSAWVNYSSWSDNRPSSGVLARAKELSAAVQQIREAADAAGVEEYVAGARVGEIIRSIGSDTQSYKGALKLLDDYRKALAVKALQREQAAAEAARLAQDKAAREAQEIEDKKAAAAQRAADAAAAAWERARNRELAAADKIIARSGKDAEDALYAKNVNVAAALGGPTATHDLSEIERHLRAAKATAEEAQQRLSEYARKWLDLSDQTSWSIAAQDKAFSDYRDAQSRAFGKASPLMQAIADGAFLDGVRQLSGDLSDGARQSILLAQAQVELAPATYDLAIALLAGARDAEQYRAVMEGIAKATSHAAQEHRDAAAWLYGSPKDRDDAKSRGVTREKAGATWDSMTPEQRQRAIAQTNSFSGALSRAYEDSQNLGGALGGACVNAIDGFSNALANAITSGENFGDAMKNIFRALLSEIIAAIVKMLVLRALMAAIGLSTGGEVPTGGPTIQAAGGWMVPGHGPLVDSVPAMLTPGEVVLSRPEAERYLAGNAAPSLNLGVSVYGPHDLAADMVREINSLAKRRNVVVVATHNAAGRAL